jgi:integrase/recombinase XerC
METIELRVGFLNHLQFERRLSKHTLFSYKTDLDQFFYHLDKNFRTDDLESIRFQHIRSWLINLMEMKRSPRTVNHKITVLKTFYKYLLRQNAVSHNPMLKIRSPKMSKRLTVFIQNSSMDVLLDNIEFGSDFGGVRNQLIIEIFYATGIRLTELIGLMQSNVDLYACTIKVLGKRNKERIIPFAGSLKSKMIKYLDIRQKMGFADAEYFFITEKGDKMYEKLVYRVVNRYLSMVTTVKKKSPHVLRHTFATHMLNNGADINAIKELLGHSSLTATQVYTHNTVEKLKNIHKQAHPRA